VEQTVHYRDQGQIVTTVKDERVRQQFLSVLLGEGHPVTDVKSVEINVQFDGSVIKRNIQKDE
jgi:hypothetical protein